MICHTSEGKRRALPVEYQVKTLIEAVNIVRKSNHDYGKELYQTGYGLDLVRSEKDYYLSHLMSNGYGASSIFRAVTSLPVDPFNTSHADLLKIKSKPGRKTTDAGKNTRGYSQHESKIIQSHFDGL